jgi:glutamine synthetase
MAAIDGIQKKTNPGDPLEVDLYKMSKEEAAKIPQTPDSLSGALDALQEDHDFLLQGDVFTKDVIDTWIGYKREHEVDALRTRPHPFEFCMYYDV